MAGRKPKSSGAKDESGAKKPRAKRAPKVVDAEVVEPLPAKPPRPAAKGDVVDAEIVSESPSAPRPRRRAVVEAKAAEVERDEDADEDAEAAEPEDVEPAVDELEDVEADDEVPAALVKAKPQSLSRSDPLSAYMREVTRHPLLTREEEVALARKLRDEGDSKAAYRLVASNLRLVVKLAHQYHRNPMSLLDLVQEGNIGLMQAVKKFDPERGVKLSSYAAWWIRAYILRYIMDNWKMVKIGTTEAQRKLFFKLRQEQNKLSAEGYDVTPKLLAERLRVSEKDVIEMDQRLGNDELSIDARMPGDEDGKQSRADRLLPAGPGNVAEDLANNELKAIFRERLAEFAKLLNEKERYIFEKRLTSDEPMTLQDIGSHYGVSRERARQLEAALIVRMREYMRETIPDFDLVSSAND